ncbi:MBL fold metallo-hydrolase [Taklimakanibacter deserti]|uniref:MBL fold metallo-hydrolase n=1 Tax=Taklimakanibacter deserti TaxID=2267839 RepID=UPI0034D4F179
MTALRFLAFLLLLVPPFTAAEAQAPVSECLAMAQGPGLVQPARYREAALEASQVRFTFVGHSTFLIESPGGVTIATDYSGYANGIVPDVVTMNHAHSTHYTDFPDPKIKHVLRGWNPQGGPARHDLQAGDVRIRNVTTDIRGGALGRVPDGNSIFIFEIAGLCIGHLGHLHHELSPAQLGSIGRLDIVLVPVDGTYTMAQANMLTVLKELKARIVIPMHYFRPETLSRFINGLSGTLAVDYKADPTVILSAKTLPEKPTLIVLPGY